MKIKRLLSSYYYNVRKDKTLTFTKFRLWRCNLGNDQQDIEKILAWDDKMVYDFTKIDADCVNILDSDKKKKVEDLNFIDGAIFLVESPKESSGLYTFRAMEDVFRERDEEVKAESSDGEPDENAPVFDMKEMLDYDLGAMLGNSR